MPWREVYLRYMGIIQANEGLRRVAYIIHSSLVQKATPPYKLWPLPLDAEVSHTSTRDRLLKRQLELANGRRSEI